MIKKNNPIMGVLLSAALSLLNRFFKTTKKEKDKKLSEETSVISPVNQNNVYRQVPIEQMFLTRKIIQYN